MVENIINGIAEVEEPLDLLRIIETAAHKLQRPQMEQLAKTNVIKTKGFWARMRAFMEDFRDAIDNS